MRVLVVSHNYPRFPGDPAGAYVARLATAAAAAAAQVRVIAPHAPGAPLEESHDGVAVRRFRYAPDALERVGYRGDVSLKGALAPARLVMLPGFLYAFRRALRTAIAEFTPDVIHAHWWFPAGWLVAGAGVPFLVTSHGSDVRVLERSRLMRRLAAPVFARAAAVTAASRYLADAITRSAPALAAPVRVTPMPVDIDRFAAGRRAPRAAPPRILYAGNLVPLKGVDVLLRAFGRLRAAGVDAGLRIVGEGPAEAALRTLATALGVTDRVSWSPFVPQDRMPAEYGAAAVTVLPSRAGAEGLGLTLVEALLAGSAVAGTDTGGIREVVADGETGLLFPDGADDVLADRLARLLADAALRARLTDEGARRVTATYAPAAAARPFLDLYHDAARGHGAR